MTDEQQQPEVVIVDGRGTEHRFPAGFDPKRAAAIVRGGPSSTPKRTWGDTARDVVRGLDKSVVGSIVGAGNLIHKIPGFSEGVDLLYGQPGLSKQAMSEATAATTPTNTPERVGAFVGDAAQAFLLPGGQGRFAARALTNAGAGAVYEGVKGGDPVAGAVTGGVGGEAAPALKAGAKWLYGKALRPVLSDLRHMPEFAKFGGDVNAVKESLVNTGLHEGLNVSRGGLSKAGMTIDAIDDAVKQAVHDASARGVTVDPMAITRDASRFLRSKFQVQNFPAEDMNVIASRAKAFLSGTNVSKPRFKAQSVTTTSPIVNASGGPITTTHTVNVPAGRTPVPTDVERVFEMKRGSNAKVRRAYGELKGADTEAEKAYMRAEGDAIKRAVPGVAPQMSREHDLLNWQTAADRRVFNAGNDTPLGLLQHIGLAAKNPALFIASTAQRPGLLSPLARLAHNGIAPTTPALRAAILALLAQQQEPPK